MSPPALWFRHFVLVAEGQVTEVKGTQAECGLVARWKGVCEVARPWQGINPEWVVAECKKMRGTASPMPLGLQASPPPDSDVYPLYTHSPVSQVHQTVDTVHLTLFGSSHALRTFPDLLTEHFPLRHHYLIRNRPGVHVDELRHPSLPFYCQVTYQPSRLRRYPRSMISLDLQEFDSRNLLWMHDFLRRNAYTYSLSRVDLALDFLCRPSAPPGALDEIITFLKSHLILKRATDTLRWETTTYLNLPRQNSQAIRLYPRPAPAAYGHDASPRIRLEFVAHRPKIRKMHLTTLEDVARFPFAKLLDHFSFVDVAWARFEAAMFRSLGATTPDQQAAVRQRIAAECSSDATLQDLVLFYRKFIPGTYPQLDSRFVRRSEFHDWLAEALKRQDRRRLVLLTSRGGAVTGTSSEGGVA